MSYASDVPQTEGMGRYAGVELTNPGMPHIIEKPGEKGRTVFRIFPEIQNGNEMPWRLNSDPCNFSYWMFAERAIRMAGVKNKFTCITAVKGKDRKIQGPIDIFVGQMHLAIKNSPGSIPREWLKWADSYKAGGGGLPRTEMCGFLQGALLENKDKKFIGPDGRSRPQHPVLLIMPRSGREGIEKECNTEVPGYTGSPEDFNARFKSGDVCSLAGGKFLQLTFIPSSGTAFAHYQVNFLPQVWSLESSKAMIVNEWKPWKDLLRYMTEEEQMKTLMEYYPAEAVDFIFGHTPWVNLLTPDVRGSWDKYTQKQQQAQAAAYHQQHAAQMVQQTQQPYTMQQPPLALPAALSVPPTTTVAMPAQFEQQQMPYNGPTSTVIMNGKHVGGPAPTTLPPWDPQAGLSAPPEFDIGPPGEYSMPSNSNVYPPATAAAAQVPFNVPPPQQADPTGEVARTNDAKARLAAARQAMSGL